MRAAVVAFDSTNDVAILRIGGPTRPPLRVRGAAQPGRAVAILGYPGDGPLTAAPGRIGSTSRVLTRDAYGHGPVSREITAVGGRVRHGNSGGPAVDAQGDVQTMIFAARIGEPVGYGVPVAVVRNAARTRSATGVDRRLRVRLKRR